MQPKQVISNEEKYIYFLTLFLDDMIHPYYMSKNPIRNMLKLLCNSFSALGHLPKKDLYRNN